MVNLKHISGFIRAPSSSRCSETWLERLYHFWTPIVLLTCATFLLLFRTWGSHINCWATSDFTPAMVRYMESRCWLDQYKQLMNVTASATPGARTDQKKQYSAWVPIVLLMMVPCFKLPYWFWKLFCYSSKIDLDKLVSFTDDIELSSPKDRAVKVRNAAQYMSGLTSKCGVSSDDADRPGCGTWLAGCLLTVYPRLRNNTLLWLYITSKILSLCIIGIQIAILNTFYPSDYEAVSFDIMREFVTKLELPDNEHFPLHILCDFKIVSFRSGYHYIVQCILPINTYNKAILLLLSMWFLLLVCIISIDLAVWVVRAILHHSKWFYKRFLELVTRNNPQLAFLIRERCLKDFLTRDDVFVLSLLRDRVSGKTVGDIVAEMAMTNEDDGEHQVLEGP